MIESARHAQLDHGLVYWEHPQVQAEEQSETLRRFREQRPAAPVETEAADD